MEKAALSTIVGASTVFMIGLILLLRGADTLFGKAANMVMLYFFIHEFVLLKLKNFWHICHMFTCVNFIVLIVAFSRKID